MSPRQLALIAMGLGALLLLWGAAALVRGGGLGSAGSERFALPVIAADKVDTVRVARRADTTLLVRQDSTRWTANGHPAAIGRIKELLGALGDSTRRTELIAEKAGSHGRLGVDSSGSRIRIAGPSGELANFVMGQRSADMDGGYVRMANDSAVWLVRGGLAPALERSPDEWRERTHRRCGGRQCRTDRCHPSLEDLQPQARGREVDLRHRRSSGFGLGRAAPRGPGPSGSEWIRIACRGGLGEVCSGGPRCARAAGRRVSPARVGVRFDARRLLGPDRHGQGRLPDGKLGLGPAHAPGDRTASQQEVKLTAGPAAPAPCARDAGEGRPRWRGLGAYDASARSRRPTTRDRRPRHKARQR